MYAFGSTRGKEREKRAEKIYEQTMDENFPKLIKSLNIELPCDPAIPLLGTYPRKMKTYIHT